MSKLAKSLFPACASFGPFIITVGCQVPYREGTAYLGLIISLPGVMMTTAALLIIYRALITLDAKYESLSAGRQPGNSISASMEKSP